MRQDPRIAALSVRLDAGEALSAPLVQLARLLVALEQRQWHSQEDIRERQLAQLSRVVDHFHAVDTDFAKRLDDAGLKAADLAGETGLTALPVLTRAQLQARTLADETAIRRRLPEGHGGVFRASTSGSTGEPVTVWKTGLGDLFWRALSLRYHLWAEFGLDGRLAAIRANQAHFGMRPDWGDSVHALFGTGPALLIDIDSDIADQLARLAEFDPHSLMVYPSNLGGLLDLMDEKGTTLATLSTIRTMGETLSPQLRGRATRQTGARVHDCYSSQELGYLAMQCPDVPDYYHVMADSVLIELLRDDGSAAEPGEIGRVVVSDLVNFATPLIRYDIGDYAMAAGACPCRRGLPALHRIMGRERNLIRKPDGSRHWPLTGFPGFRAIAPIRQYQFRQTAIDRIELRFGVERGLTEAEEAALADHVRTTLRYPFDLDFSYFEGRLPLGANGKFEEFVSLID
ncbi:MAG: hypothetical protein R3E02_13540 [Blastomonas sp.]